MGHFFPLFLIPYQNVLFCIICLIGELHKTKYFSQKIISDNIPHFLYMIVLREAQNSKEIENSRVCFDLSLQIS